MNQNRKRTQNQNKNKNKKYKGEKPEEKGICEKYCSTKKAIMNFISLGFNICTVLYTIAWGIIFVYFIYGKGEYEHSCKKLINWTKGLYILLFASAFLNIVTTLAQIYVSMNNLEGKILNWVISIKGLINFVLKIVFLIAITVIYAIKKGFKECDPLRIAALAYIIVEWTIIGLFLLLNIIVVTITMIMKQSKKSNVYKHSDEVYSDDETDL